MPLAKARRAAAASSADDPSRVDLVSGLIGAEATSKATPKQGHRARRGRIRLLDPTTGLAVYDGASFVGTIIVHDDHHRFDAYDTRDKLVGTFATQCKASRAVPRNAEGTSR
jgi:hypothetical protein